MLHNFDLLIFHYFLQLIFRLTRMTSAAKSNQKLVDQKLCNTVLILDALYYVIFLRKIVIHFTFTNIVRPSCQIISRQRVVKNYNFGKSTLLTFIWCGTAFFLSVLSYQLLHDKNSEFQAVRYIDLEALRYEKVEKVVLKGF